MRFKSWSFYRASDGLFLSLRRMTNNAEAVTREAPPGCVAIEGHFDRFRQRVDIETGEVISDMSLSEQRDRERRIDAAKLQLAELDKRQHRRVRELLAAQDPQLAKLESEAEALRAKIRDLSSAES